MLYSQNHNSLQQIKMATQTQIKLFNCAALILMSIGYLWLWYFNRNPHVLIKFMTMQAYFLTWLYFFILILNKNSILGYSIERLFELNFVLQLFVTPIYWALVHGPMVASKKFPRYEQNWNQYIHLIPIILLILDFGISKRVFQNNWKDTLKFYYFFALPINLLYSHFQRPVYKFLLYDDIGDYIGAFCFGFVLVFIHQVCYHFLKGWKKRSEEKKSEESDKKTKEK